MYPEVVLSALTSAFCTKGSATFRSAEAGERPLKRRFRPAPTPIWVSNSRFRAGRQDEEVSHGPAQVSTRGGWVSERFGGACLFERPVLGKQPVVYGLALVDATGGRLLENRPVRHGTNAVGRQRHPEHVHVHGDCVGAVVSAPVNLATVVLHQLAVQIVPRHLFRVGRVERLSLIRSLGFRV